MRKIAKLALPVAVLLGAGPALAQETVKVGALLIDTGPLAAFHQYSTRGLEVGVAAVNAAGGVNGKQLELVPITYSGTPEAALQAVTRLARTDKVAAVTGMTPTAVSLAISGRARALDTVILDPLSVAGKRCNSNFFRIKASDTMLTASYDSYLAQSDVDSWDIIAGDSTSGHDNAETFTASVEANGGKVNKQLFVPVPNPDFGTYITQLNSAPSKGLMAVIYGTDAVTFSKQQQQFGLSGKYDLILGNNYAVPAVLEAMGESAAGVVQNMVYLPAAEGDGPRAFADAFKARAGYEPDDVAFDMFMSIQFLAAAMNKAGAEDATSVSAALKGLQIDSPLGPVEMRAEDHQMVRPMIFAEAVKLAEPRDGRIMGYEIKTIIPAADYMPAPSADCVM